MILAAGILFVTKNDRRVLLVRRSDLGDHAGEWGIPGGKQEDGETLPEAARRECAEELGRDFLADKQNMAGVLALWTRQASPEVDFTTFLQVVQEPFVPTLNGEHDAFVWAPIAEFSADDPAGVAA